jgi:hypothetical protein
LPSRIGILELLRDSDSCPVLVPLWLIAETLKVRDKFRKVDWHPPIRKPSTKNRRVGQDCLGQVDSLQPPLLASCHYASDRRVPRYCERISANADQHLLADLPTSEPGLIG